MQSGGRAAALYSGLGAATRGDAFAMDLCGGQLWRSEDRRYKGLAARVGCGLFYFLAETAGDEFRAVVV
jgi:hypothetical protein